MIPSTLGTSTLGTSFDEATIATTNIKHNGRLQNSLQPAVDKRALFFVRAQCRNEGLLWHGNGTNVLHALLAFFLLF